MGVQEVQEFRDLFLSAAPGRNHELSFGEVRRMIHNIIPLGDKYVKELRGIFNEITTHDAGSSTPSTPRSLRSPNTMDFPEFLWLMMRLLDSNFARIRDKTSPFR